MRQTSLSISKTRIGGKLFWQVTVPKLGGGRERRTFKERAAAQTFFDLAKVQQKNFGTAAMSISEALRVEAVECDRELQPFGKTLRDATKFFLAHLRRQENSVPVAEAVAKFLAHHKSENDLSDRYFSDLRIRLTRFAETFGEQQIGAVAAGDISGWLDGLSVSKGTRNTFRRRVATLFAYACANPRKWRSENPFSGGKKAHVAVVTEARKKVRVFTVQQAARLLEVATDETLPFWAIALFAGLRPESELCRLRWEHIDLEERVIIVDGNESETEETKTGRRVVKMHDNLVAWLRPLARESGKVAPPNNLWPKLRADKRKLGFGTPGTETDDERNAGIELVRWTEDITRHSFISYLLAECGDIGVTSTQAGTSPDMVRRHYLSLVKPAAAAKYWEIKPAGAANVLAMRAA